MDGPKLKRTIAKIVSAEESRKNELEDRIKKHRILRAQYITSINNNYNAIAAILLGSAPSVNIGSLQSKMVKLRTVHQNAITDADKALILAKDSYKKRRQAVNESESTLTNSQALLDNATERYQEILNNDPSYTDAKTQFNNIEQKYEYLLDKQVSINTHVTKRANEVSKNIIYTYLTTSGYGTDNYASSGIVKYFDTILAKLSKYNSQQEERLNLADLSQWWNNRTLSIATLHHQQSSNLESMVSRARSSFNWHELKNARDESSAVLQKATDNKNKAERSFSKIEADFKLLTSFDTPGSSRTLSDATSLLRKLDLAIHPLNSDPSTKDMVQLIIKITAQAAALKTTIDDMQIDFEAALLRVKNAEALSDKCRRLTARKYSYSTSRARSELTAYMEGDKSADAVYRALKNIQEEELPWEPPPTMNTGINLSSGTASYTSSSYTSPSPTKSPSGGFKTGGGF